ncbi:phosphotransferase [Sphaerisporangium sp. B11E5]|uniref:phosphotransferase n=1 Tax=Sphaerisporangium sp. B11E5 TaxID=3153563 RepID=UPI00325E6B18
MRDQPMDVDEGALLDALKAWGIAPEAVAYAPVGFGDHHWIAGAAGTAEAGGARWFVTVADLPHKPYCGDGADAAFAGLRRAMDTAWSLRHEAGLPFVTAPLRTAAGETTLRFGQRYAVSVFPYADGVAGDFGQKLTPGERAPLIDMLAALHGSPPPAAIPARPLALPGRARLEKTLAEVGHPWEGGPYAEPARDLLAGHLTAFLRRLEEFDRRSAEVRGEPVVTHGEPHPGNLLRSPGGLLLVDWDTVGLAPPERDLWLAAADPADLDRYTEATGRRPDPSVLALYRLRWSLEDVSLFLEYFRSPHGRTADAEQSWSALTGTMEWLATT